MLVALGAMLLASPAVNGQPTAWSWAVSEDHGSDELVRAVVADASGASYLVGAYDHWSFLGLVAGPFGLPSVNGATDAFVVKLDANGNTLWRRRIGGSGVDIANGVALAPNGNIYVTGAFSGSVSLTSILSSILSVSSSGEKDMFLACYNPQGDLLWMVNGGGARDDMGMAVGANEGGVYVHGRTRHTAQFGGLTIGTSTAGDQSFLVRYPHTGGNPTWIRAASSGAGGNSSPGGIAVDLDNLYLVGDFTTNTLAWSTHTGTPLVSVSCANSIGNSYVTSFTNSGDVNWCKAIDNPVTAGRTSAIATVCQRLYIGGRCAQNALFPQLGTVAQSGAIDLLYVAALTRVNGEALWAWTGRGTHVSMNEVLALTPGPHGQVNLSATFKEQLTTSDGSTRAGGLDQDILLGRLDRNGHPVWLRHEIASGAEYPYALHRTNNGRLLVGGMHTGPLVLPPFNEAGSANPNIFIAEIGDADTAQDPNDPSRWKVPTPQCNAGSVFDLSQRVRGHADAVSDPMNIANANNVLGAPDGQGSLFTQAGANMVIDLGDTIPAHADWSMRWRLEISGQHAFAQLEYSMDRNTWISHPTEPQTQSTTLVNSKLKAPVAFRFLRITRRTALPSGAFRVDALTFLLNTEGGGSWSGPQTTPGGAFDPTGLLGPVSLTYTVQQGGCTFATTRTFLVTPPATGSLNGPAPLCPGIHDATLEVINLSPYAGVRQWRWSQDGQLWNTINVNGHVLEQVGLTLTTWIQAGLNSPGCGGTWTDPFVVEVGDDDAPLITDCPSDTVLYVPGNACNKQYIWPTVSAADNCSPTIVHQRTIQLQAFASTPGAPIDVSLVPSMQLPAGSHVLTENFTDAIGNTASCSYTITVLDTIAPVLACQGDIQVNADVTTCGAEVILAFPTVTENCGVSLIAQTAGPVSGSSFPIGSHIVEFTATDTAGNSATCSFIVAVMDTQPCGCGTSGDLDGDGVPDCMDGCPNDPLKTEPGICGCGQPDTDTDGDGVADCNDGCPTDPSKISPGTCGCGVPDIITPPGVIPDCLGACAEMFFLNAVGNGSDIPFAQLKTTAPTRPTLENYDPGNDSDPGIMIKKGGSGLNESDHDQFQMWSMNAPTSGIDGIVSLLFWSAMKDFDDDKEGELRIFLTDCNGDGSSCTSLAQVTISRETWHDAGSGWIEEHINFGHITHTFSNGRRLAVKMIVLNDSGDDMWIAYDAVPYPAGLSIGSTTDTDGDGVPDCLDGCPNDPLKQDPGLCGCSSPEPGTLCDDGNPDTVNDSIGPDCQCAGLQLDCAGVPAGTAYFDNCGNCVAGNTGEVACVQDCNGDYGGTAFLDNCGDCIGGNTGDVPCVQDCNGDFGGSAFLDNCSDCVGGNTGDPACVQDCNGDFGGTAFLDNCGDCVGGNTGDVACVQDCNGDFGGTAVLDNCGDCVGGNTGEVACVADCNGDFGGTAVLDNCGICVSGNTGEVACVADCNGDFGGTAVLDNCGICVSGNTGEVACVADCNGDFGGTAFLDNCGDCVGGNTSEVACPADCNGDFGGTAFLDNCGDCVGGNTGEVACLADCNGDFGGTAFLDNCGDCVGGNTGEVACLADCNGDFGGTAFQDYCGDCVGGNTSEVACLADCNGDFGGTAFLDNCGTCVGGNTGEVACVADCNGDFGGTAVLDNCGTCVGGNTAEVACVADCNGDFGGTAFLDNCGDCVGGNTGNLACLADCNGDFGGTAFLDNCNDCVGGTTGEVACLADCNGDFGGTAFLDNCGDCVGGNTNEVACLADCNGDFGGTAFVDNCGTCVGGNTGEVACVADCNGDFGGTAVLDNCGTCVGGNTGDQACVQDCNGDFGGTAFLDNCGDCVGGSTGEVACLADCNGDFGGTAFLDNCGDCVSGNTGEVACVQDCNGDYGGIALPGSPCDDGQSITINDIWTSDCTCLGELVECSSDAGPDATVCGTSAELQATGVGVWLIDPDLSISSLNSSNAIVTASGPGTHMLQWQVTNGPCTAVDTVFITFLEQADATFGYSATTFCTGDLPQQPWTTASGGSFTANSLDISLNPGTGEVDPANSLPGSYTIQHAFSGSCPTIAEAEITISATGDASWTVPGALCTNGPVIDLDPYVTGDPGGSWSGTGISGSVFDPALAGESAHITYTVGAVGCTSSSEQAIVLQQAPVADAGNDHTVCGYSYGLQAGSDHGLGTWSLPQGTSLNGSLNDPHAILLADDIGTYSLTWSVLANGCLSEDHVTITFLADGANAWVDAGQDQYLDMVRSTDLQGDAAPGAEFDWQLIMGSGTAHAPWNASSYVDGLSIGDNVFVLEATWGSCATLRDTVLVHVTDLFIPEGFSPNDDGVNDRFEISGLGAYPGSQLQVFNRWGQEVYRNDAYDNNWDGRNMQGKALPHDTYFYVLNLNGDRAYNGSIIIKR